MGKVAFFTILLVPLVFLIIGIKKMNKKDKSGHNSVSGEVLGRIGIVLAIIVCVMFAYFAYRFFADLRGFHGM